MFQGRIQDNVPWDEDTANACATKGQPKFTVGYYGKNFKECHRYKHRAVYELQGSGGINNCGWDRVS